MNRVLVTGGQGLLGRYFIDAQLKADETCSIIAIGRSQREDDFFSHHISIGKERKRAPLPKALRYYSHSHSYSYYTIDINNINALVELLRQFQPRTIVHLASGLRDDQTEDLFRTNVVGTESLYQCIYKSGCSGCNVLVTSSGSVYGQVEENLLPLKESTSTSPFDMYSISKDAQEKVALVLGRKFGIATTIARVFNVVAPAQDERHICGRLASQLVAIETGIFPAVIELGSVSTTRDFVDARDVAKCLVTLSKQRARDEIFNVASGRETKIQELIETIISLARVKEPLKIVNGPQRIDDMPRNYANVRKISDLGIQLGTSLRESLSDLLDYYRECVAEN